MSHNTNVEVICKGITNPYNHGIYSNFFVTEINTNGEVMAKSDNLSVNIDYRRFTADVTSQLTYLETLKEWIFTFTFKANYLNETYSTEAVLEVTFPNHNLICDPLQILTGNLEKISNWKFRVFEAPSNPLAFTIACRDHIASVNLNGISFVLTDEPKSHLVLGSTSISVRNSKALASKNSLVECMHRYPTFPVRCNVTVTRTTTEPMKVVALFGELLNPAYTHSHLSAGICGMEVEGYSPICTYNKYGEVFLTFPSLITSSSFKIVDLEHTNLEGSERDQNKFSIRTYSTDPVLPQSIVDRGDLSFTALVDCNFPCNTCQDSLTACTSCVAGPNIKLFLMPPEFACIPSCPDKYFIDSRKVCRPCPKHCASCSFKDFCDTCEAGYKKWNMLCHEKCPLNTVDIDGICTLCSPKCLTCQGNTNFCTACKNGKFNYEGECYDECIEGTGPVNSAKQNYCLPCGEGCDECTHTKGQPQSTGCTKCASGYSSAEAVPPLTCVPAQSR
eukprot:TRINITY_DN7350_c0_g1_i11.p1 TRINITY_DN7350_c0_g1~~TRINITY_DN7350_c0_g1_i11.p1  ORF type:complete len:591 (-),score=65.80 TRINITY_DN7350_c0_g1_i11:205-1716(-)